MRRSVRGTLPRTSTVEIPHSSNVPERTVRTRRTHSFDGDPCTHLERGASTHVERESTSDADPDATTGPERNATVDYDPDATEGFVHSPGLAAANTEVASRSTGGREAASCPGSQATRSWACWAPAAWGSCTRRGTSGSTAWSR